MAKLVVAAEISIPQPTDALGWAVLGTLAFIFLYVVVQGFNSFFDKWGDVLKKLFFVVFAVLALIFLVTQRPWEEENWGEVEVEVFPSGLEGTETRTDPDHHLYDPDHTHDS